MNIAIVALGFCLVGSAMASCLEDVAKDSNYRNCWLSFSAYLQREMQNTPDVMAVMCSPEGQGVASCMFAYIQQCPVLAAQGGSDLVTGASMQLQLLGNMTTMCAMMTTTTTTPSTTSDRDCGAVMQCLPRVKPFWSATEGNTLNSYFPAWLDDLCGSVKSTLDCLAGTNGECPDYIRMYENSILVSMFINWVRVKQFTRTECPKFPKSLGTNACVKRELESTKFVDCYATVGSVYDTPEKKKSCPAFLAGSKCVNDNVGKACGADTAEALVAAATMFIEEMPHNCTSQDGGKDGGQSGTDGNGSEDIQASLWTVIATATAFVILFR